MDEALYDELLDYGRTLVSEHYSVTGVLVSVQGLTWNATKRLYEPPRVIKATGIPAVVQSLASIRDPDLPQTAKDLNISLEAYRRIVIPVGAATILRDDRIIKEPVSGSSDTYRVVDIIAPDETSPLEILMHCQKL